MAECAKNVDNRMFLKTFLIDFTQKRRKGEKNIPAIKEKKV